MVQYLLAHLDTTKGTKSTAKYVTAIDIVKTHLWEGRTVVTEWTQYTGWTMSCVKSDEQCPGD